MGLGGILISIVGWFVLLIVGAAIQSGFISGVLDIANGQQVSVGSFFRPRNIGQVIVAGIDRRRHHDDRLLPVRHSRA